MVVDEESLNKINNTLNSVDDTLSSVSKKINDVKNTFPDLSNQTQKLKEKTDQTTNSTDKLINSNEKLIKSTDKVVNKNNILSNTVSSYAKQLITGSNNTNNLRQSIEGTVKTIALATGATVGLGNAFTNTWDKATIGIESADASTKAIEKMTKALSGGKTSNTVFSKIVSIMGKIPEGARKISEGTAQIKKMESSVLSLYGQYGGFSDGMNRLEFTKNLEGQMAKIIRMNKTVANQTNLTSSEVESYAQKLMQVPGAFKQVIDMTEEGASKMSLLEGAIRISRGTTGNFTDSLDALNLQFTQFNQKNKNALDFMAKTYDLSQKLGVGFKDVNSIIVNTVKNFAMFGDNMKSSINLVGALTKAIKTDKFGMGPTSDIVNSVLNSMKDLNLAQKSFLSSQTGGPGGLRGAFQIDQMLREGNLDKVYQMMESSLRQQFGGRVVTLQEGAGSDTAAAELTKQVKFLTEGPFGRVVTSTEQAYRLLEAFEKSGPEGIDTSEIGRETAGALENANKADMAIQNKQSSALTTISNDIKGLLQEAQITNALTLRGTKENKEIVNVLNEYRKRTSSLSLGLTEKIGSSADAKSPVTALLEDLTNTERFIAGGKMMTSESGKTVATPSSGLVPRLGAALAQRKQDMNARAMLVRPNSSTENLNKVNLPNEANNKLAFEPLQIEVKVKIDEATGRFIEEKKEITKTLTGIDIKR